MSSKTGTVIVTAVTVLLALEISYLKRLPGSLVRVYSTAEIVDFNRPPTEGMTVCFDGVPFDYRIPRGPAEHALEGIREELAGGDPDGMGQAIAVARWVRERMRFGERDDSAFAMEAQDLPAAGDDGLLLGLCDLYSRLFAIACQSLSIPARIVELQGHVVPEVFIGESAGWVMIDPTFGYYATSAGKDLSVAELIRCYREGHAFSAIVFAEGKGDDCLYGTESEAELKEIYLNGFTVVSRQAIDYRRIVESLVKQRTLLIAKLQFLDENSTVMGSREGMIRTAVALTALLWVVVVCCILLAKRRNREGTSSTV